MTLANWSQLEPVWMPCMGLAWMALLCTAWVAWRGCFKTMLGKAGSAWRSLRGLPPKGPPRFVLLGAGLKLRRDATRTTVWELLFNGQRPDGLYLDPSGVVEQIKAWVKCRCQFAGVTDRNRMFMPLMISGLVKTGKSFTLLELVPAVVSEVLRGLAGCALRSMTVLLLRGDDLDREDGAERLLLNLLATAVKWAADGNVPVDDNVWKRAKSVLAQPVGSTRRDEAGEAVIDLLHGFKVPVLVLFDELQSFLQPTKDGQLDHPGAMYIRNVVLRRLLRYAPSNMLWCLTGSNMALAWMAIAEIPTNGYSLMNMTKQVKLPAKYPEDLMQLAWDRLAEEYAVGDRPLLSARLLQWCDTSPALLTALFEAAQLSDEPLALDEAVSDFLYDKIVSESFKGWELGLSGLPAEVRRALLDLASAGVGTKIDHLHEGLKRFLRPYLEKTDKGLSFLRDDYQRQLLRLIINPDGSMRSQWEGWQCSATLTQLDLGWTLLRLGEVADYLFGPRQRQNWASTSRPVGSEDFKRVLVTLANMLSDKLPEGEGGSAVSRWEQQPWFQELLRSKWNSNDSRWFADNKGMLNSDFDVLVFVLRLIRNILAHQKPWEGEEVVDVDVLMTLPHVLGMRISDLSSMAVKGLRMLARRTVEDATVERNGEPQPAGGSSSSGIGSGTGGGSSGIGGGGGISGSGISGIGTGGGISGIGGGGSSGIGGRSGVGGHGGSRGIGGIGSGIGGGGGGGSGRGGGGRGGGRSGSRGGGGGQGGSGSQGDGSSRGAGASQGEGGQGGGVSHGTRRSGRTGGRRRRGARS